MRILVNLTRGLIIGYCVVAYGDASFFSENFEIESN
jgi:hypothetical protein